MRTRAPEPVVAAARREVARLDPEQPLYDVKTMERAFFEELASNRVITGLFIVFAVVALGLATVGLYGLVSFTVSQRTREIGVRLALGARRRDILRLVIARGCGSSSPGWGPACLSGLALARAMASVLLGREPARPRDVRCRPRDARARLARRHVRSRPSRLEARPGQGPSLRIGVPSVTFRTRSGTSGGGRMGEQGQPERVIRSVAPVRICDNGGWTDTWFARHGKVFNIAVTPLVEVEVRSYATSGVRAPSGCSCTPSTSGTNTPSIPRVPARAAIRCWRRPSAAPRFLPT